MFVSAYSSSRAKQLNATELPRPFVLFESGSTVYELAQEFSIKPPDGVQTSEGGRRPVPPQLAHPGRTWAGAYELLKQPAPQPTEDA